MSLIYKKIDKDGKMSDQHQLHIKIPVALDMRLQELAKRKMTSKGAILRDLIRIEAERVGL